MLNDVDVHFTADCPLLPVPPPAVTSLNGRDKALAALQFKPGHYNQLLGHLPSLA